MNIYLTEKQMRMCLNEMNLAVHATSSNPGPDIKDAAKEARKNGLDPASKDVNFEITGDNARDVGLTESDAIISFTKRQLQEARVRNLMRSSYLPFTKADLRNNC